MKESEQNYTHVFLKLSPIKEERAIIRFHRGHTFSMLGIPRLWDFLLLQNFFKEEVARATVLGEKNNFSPDMVFKVVEKLQDTEGKIFLLTKEEFISEFGLE